MILTTILGKLSSNTDKTHGALLLSGADANMDNFTSSARSLSLSPCSTQILHPKAESLRGLHPRCSVSRANRVK